MKYIMPDLILEMECFYCKEKVYGCELHEDYPQQIQHILQLFSGPRPRFACKRIGADYTGCGRPVVQMLIESGLTNLMGIIFNARDTITGSRTSFKTSMYHILLQEISYDTFKYPDLEHFKASAGNANLFYYHKCLSQYDSLIIEHRERINPSIYNPDGHDDVPDSDAIALFQFYIDKKRSSMPKGASYHASR